MGTRRSREVASSEGKRGSEPASGDGSGAPDPTTRDDPPAGTGLAGVLALSLVAVLVVASVPVATAGAVPAGTTGASTASLAEGSGLPNGTVTDATENRSFVADYCVRVGDVRYAESGAVSTVRVDLRGGNLGTVSAGAIESVRVVLRNDSEGILAVGKASYDDHGTAVGFDGTVHGVDRVVIAAKVGAQVEDGARIDAAYTLVNDGNESDYDTDGVQTARTANAGFVVGTVQNERGLPVEGATVDVIDVGSGAVVTTLTTDADGRFGPQQVVPNRTYTVDASKRGYVGGSFSRQVFVGPGETQSIPVTLEVRVAADTLRLVTADLGDPNTTEDDRLTDEEPILVADGDSSTKVQLVAIVENSSAETGDGPGAGFFDVTVALEFANDTGVGDFLDNDRIDRRINVTTTERSDIDGDGYEEAYAPFTITADAANGSTMYRAAVFETVRGSFTNALGREVVALGIEGASDPRFENGTVNESDREDPAPGEATDPATLVVSGVDDVAGASPGDPLAVTATVAARNGSLPGNRTVELRIDADGDGTLSPEETVATGTVGPAGGEAVQVGLTAEVPDLADGEYEYGVVAGPPSENATATLTVSTEPWREYDDDGDGAISSAELGSAVRDWAAGAIGTDQLNDVIAKWARGN